MSFLRTTGSRLMNAAFRRALSLNIHDGSSALRLYHTRVVNTLSLDAKGYDILQEVLVRAYAAGWRVAEIPMTYVPNPAVRTKAHRRLTRAYVGTAWTLWKLRNSIAAADYDYRAHDSVIPLQRYWQRSRYRHVTELIAGEGAVLDAGCGSSHIIAALPRGSVALDILAKSPNNVYSLSNLGVVLFRNGKLKAAELTLKKAIALAPTDEFTHTTLGIVYYQQSKFDDARRFFAPGGYADEHISHYTRRSLLADFVRRGFTHEATRYVLRGELILAFRKPGAPA